MSLFLLDTNILIHGARRNEIWEKVILACNPMMSEARPLVHVVSQGEALAFAEQNSWGDARRTQLAFLLGYFDAAQIGPREIDAYALLDTYSRRLGFRMGKNDLWIAAAAHTTGATLVTCDKDFDHLDSKFLQRLWIDPTIP